MMCVEMASTTLAISMSLSECGPSSWAKMDVGRIREVHAAGGHLCLLDRAAEVGPIASAFLRSLERTAINEVAELG
jgi:hypothetical protein